MEWWTDKGQTDGQMDKHKYDQNTHVQMHVEYSMYSTTRTLRYYTGQTISQPLDYNLMFIKLLATLVYTRN